MNLSDYERMKANWIRTNPNATPAEYAKAMRKIAQKCGV